MPIVDVQAFADGQHPISLENLREVRELADRYGARLVLDGSRDHRERLVRAASREGTRRSGHPLAGPPDGQDEPRPAARRGPGPEGERRRAPEHRQPRRPRAVHERGGGLRGAAHLRRDGRTHHGGARAGARGDGRRGRGPLGDAPDRALHAAPARRGRAAGAGVRRRLHPGRPASSPGRSHGPGHLQRRALPAGGRPGRGHVPEGLGGPGARPDPPTGDDERAARPGRRRDRRRWRGRRRGSQGCRWPSGGNGATRWRTTGSSRTWSPSRSTRSPYQIHTIERVGVLTRGQREQGDPGGRLQHVPAPVGGRDHRPAHRLGHLGDEHGPVGGVRGRARHTGHLVRVSPARGGAAGRARLRARHPDPPGTGRGAHPQPDHDPARPAGARQHVLHHHQAPSGAGGRRLRRRDRGRGARPREHLPVEGQHRPGQAARGGGRARRRPGRLHLLRALREHGRWPAGRAWTT